MKSIKQTFGIFIVALALFGAYSLVCPKKPVDDSVSDDFRAELAEEGIFLSNSEDTGGKSALFNTLGNLPSLSSSAQTASGTPTNSALPSLFGEGSSSALKHGQFSDDDLDLQIPPDFSGVDNTSAWNGNATQVLNDTHEMFELPLLEVSGFDEVPVWSENSVQTPQNAPDAFELPAPSFDDAPLFDVPVTMSTEPVSMESVEVALMPKISEDSLDSWDFFDVTPGKTLDSSTTFTPIDSTTTVVPNRTEVPQESDQIGFDSPVVYNQRPPAASVNPMVTPPPDGSVRPLPSVTTEGVMTLASGTTSNNLPETMDHSALTETFSFSNPATDQSVTDFGDVSDFSTLNSPASDLRGDFASTPASGDSIPGIARSSQRRESPEPAHTSLQEAPAARNPISQSTPRPAIIQRINQIKDILNDETKEYRLGHQMITELYMSNLNFAERELVLPLADKCGWAAFFSSRSFDPYGWGRTIRPTDTIQSLAAENGISPELILKINRLEHPSQLTPGKENVKIPKGPFDATIFLDRKEMIITARGLFACRFRIGIGNPEIITEGVYQIESKFLKPRYLGEFGEIESDDPRNPLGTHWIGLDQEIGIHGTNTPSCLGTDNAPVEGFSLDNHDVAEVYDMFISESRITVKR